MPSRPHQRPRVVSETSRACRRNAETRRSPGTARRRSRDVGNARGSGGWVRGRASPGVPRARVGVEAMDDGEARLAVSPASGRAEAASVATRRETQRVLFRGRSHLNPGGMSPSSIASSFSSRTSRGAPLCSRDEAAVPEVRARALEDGEVSPSRNPRMRPNTSSCSCRSKLRVSFSRRVRASECWRRVSGRARWPPPPSRGPRRGVRQHPPGAVDERSHGRRGSGRRWRGRAPPSRKPRGRIIFARRPRQQRSAHDVES